MTHDHAPAITSRSTIDQCIAAFPVRGSLICNDSHIFVAYYNSDHQLCVARRSIDGGAWERQTLPEQVGWDSHNYITMSFDPDGFIHLSANMHVDPLVYFISEAPGEIQNWQRMSQLIGDKEDRCTYPQFLNNKDGRLVFHYRDGSSGDGSEIYNIYDHQSKNWQRLLDQPLLDGEGLMNAYAVGPHSGPDGNFHMCWVWRDTYHAETNHDVSYAWSPDLKRWYNAAGTEQPLPITLANSDCIVDPVPVEGGCINGCTRIGFDKQEKAFIVFHKFDDEGLTQLYCACFDGDNWQTHQISDWNWRWFFAGGGSLEFGINVADPILDEEEILIPYKHKEHGNGLIVLDSNSLAFKEDRRNSTLLSDELYRVESAIPDMRANIIRCGNCVLRWESRPNNRDAEPDEYRDICSPLELIELE